MSTLIASFPDLSTARNVLKSLLSDGMSPDDISLIGGHLEGRAGEGSPGLGKLGDASVIVGREDDPMESEDNGRASLAESNVGGGISTSGPDDDVSDVGEMDDSQSAEDSQSGLSDNQSTDDRESDELRRAFNTGFPTGVAGVDSSGGSRITPDHDLDGSLDTMTIPGFGYVMGGGALATIALDFADLPPIESCNTFRSFLEGEGVSEEIADSMLLNVRDGGAVLAVEIVPGAANPDAIEDLATKAGATKVGLFDSPRY
jgi:hypothetical protein